MTLDNISDTVRTTLSVTFYCLHDNSKLYCAIEYYDITDDYGAGILILDTDENMDWSNTDYMDSVCIYCYSSSSFTQSYDLPKSTEVLNWIEGYYPVAREHPIIPG